MKGDLGKSTLKSEYCTAPCGWCAGRIREREKKPNRVCFTSLKGVVGQIAIAIWFKKGEKNEKNFHGFHYNPALGRRSARLC